MRNCPIVEHDVPAPSSADLAAVDRLAKAIRRERPSLEMADDFRNLVPQNLDDAPTLHLDDLTAIPHLDGGRDVRYYQERARLRAGDYDLVATSLPVSPGYESYCRHHLGLGAVEWLHPRPVKNALRIAESCWEDERARATLVARIRDGLRFLHPHMGTFAVWELAALLRDASRCQLKVIAPPPRLSAWINDKVSFAEVVYRLFGADFVPRTLSAYNFAILAQRVRELADSCQMICIKLPNSAGGDGTVVLRGDVFAGQPLVAVRERLKEVLPTLNWSGESELLVDSWETDVISSPSAQLWIPPPDEGGPIVEGIFVQDVEGPTGCFVGSTPATFAAGLRQEIATRSWLLGRLLQRLGYLGRCSFDLILVGPSMAHARLEFIECNGRWGGTSAPMTLMNRLLGDWSTCSYATRVCEIPALGSMTFLELLRVVRDDLFERTTARGNIIVAIPGRMVARRAIDVIAIGDEETSATTRISNFIERVRGHASANACLPS